MEASVLILHPLDEGLRTELIEVDVYAASVCLKVDASSGIVEGQGLTAKGFPGVFSPYDASVQNREATVMVADSVQGAFDRSIGAPQIGNREQDQNRQDHNGYG